MRIAIFSPGLSGGGAERVALHWALGLGERGDEVIIRLARPSPQDLVQCDVSVSSLGETGFLKSIWRFRSDIDASRVDAVIALMPFCNLVALLALSLIPRNRRPALLISEHSFHAGPKRKLPRNFRLQLLLAKALYRRADACLASSHAVAADVQRRYRLSQRSIWVIPNPVLGDHDIREWARPPVAARDATPALIVPSRLVRQKRPWLALECAAVLGETYGESPTVHFFGEGELKGELIKRAEALNIPVIFYGYVDRWASRIPDNGIVMLTSYAEGFGNVLVEAAARGVPSVVSSRALGVSDACIPGVTAVVVAGDTANDFAAGVVEAASLESGSSVGDWLVRFTVGRSSAVLREALTASLKR